MLSLLRQRSNRVGLAILVGSLLLGAVVAAPLVVFGHAPWTNALFLSMPLTLVYTVLTHYSAYYLCRSFPLNRKTGVRSLLILAGSALVSGLVWMGLAHALNALLTWTLAPWFALEIDVALSVVLASLGGLVYGLVAAVHLGLLESARAGDAETASLTARLAAQQAELRLLRTQIDPHFLFNSLNSISALTAQNPIAAREMCLQLADFFRQGLGLAGRERISLRAELQLIRSFLAIEKVRFGARLQVSEDIAPATLDCLVLPMLLQPLVENAVKHGISQLLDGGHIHMTASIQQGSLQLLIENEVDPEPVSGAHHRSQTNQGGLGLANVRLRLVAAFADAAACHPRHTPGKFSVTLSMPVELPAQTEGADACG